MYLRQHAVHIDPRCYPQAQILAVAHEAEEAVLLPEGLPQRCGIDRAGLQPADLVVGSLQRAALVGHPEGPDEQPTRTATPQPLPRLLLRHPKESKHCTLGSLNLSKLPSRRHRKVEPSSRLADGSPQHLVSVGLPHRRRQHQLDPK